MSNQTFERAVLDWLEDGSDRTPRPAIDAVLLAVKTTPQERGLRLPRRFPAVPYILRIAAAMAVLAVFGAGVILIGGATSTARPSPTTGLTPRSTAAPSVATGETPTGRIAYVSDRESVGGNSDIFVMNADGSGLQNLTRDPDEDGTPAWSPDGASLAYVRGGSVAEVWVMDADGSNQRQITTLGGSAWRPSWSPDGASIAFADRDTGAIYVIGADGSSRRTLVAAGGPADREPAWSPSGDLIAYTDGDILRVIRPDGTGDRPYIWSTDPSQTSAMAAWAPDGRQLAVANPRMLGLVTPDGDSPLWKSLGEDLQRFGVEFPAWSPDGRWIAFDAGGPNSRIRDVSVIGADGTSFRFLTLGAAEDWGPTWH